MELKDKLNAIFSFGSKEVLEQPVSDSSMSKEATAFIGVIHENLKNKVIGYDEAVARITRFAKTPIERSMLIFKIDNYEFTRTASLKTAKEDDVNKDSLMKEFEELEAKYGLASYAQYMRNEYRNVKTGYHLGTGDEPKQDQWDTKVDQWEEKQKNIMNKEGDKMSKEHGKEKELTNRAAEMFEKRLNKNAYHLGTGDEVDSKKWDNNVDKFEDSNWKKDEANGSKEEKVHERTRKEYLRAKNLKITLVADFEEPRKSVWNFYDKADGQLVLSASVDDILDGAEAPKEVIEDTMKPEFGKMLSDKVDEVGLEAVAEAIIPEAIYVEAKKKAKDKKEKEDKEKEDKKEEKEEKKEEKEASIDNAIGLAIKQASAVVKYYTLKGMLADAKIEHGSHELVKSAESKISELGLLITAGADAAEIDTKTEEISGDLGKLDEEEVKGEDKAEEETEAEETEEIELDEEEKKILEEILAEAEKGDLEAVKEKTEEALGLENEEIAKEEGPKEIAADSKKTVKTAAESKMYGLTKENFQSEFHSGKAKDKDAKMFHNIWEVKKALESLVNKKPTGKLASLYSKAKTGDAGARSYFAKIYGDPKYVAALFEDNTVEKQESKQDKPGFEAKYAPKSNKHAELDTVERTKKAYKMSLDMQKRGLIKSGDDHLNTQVNNFLNMTASNFDAYVDSIENLQPTTELEEGRFKVVALEKPMVVAQGKCVAEGYVDDKKVGFLTAEELELKDNRVTRAALQIGITHLRTALDNGILDGILSDGKAAGKDGEEVNVMSGTTDKPMSSKLDLSQI